MSERGQRGRAGRRAGTGAIAWALLVLLLVMTLTGCNHTGVPAGDYEAVYDRVQPTFAFTDGTFTILQFTDLHLFGNNARKEKKTLQGMRKAIRDAAPDLVVLTGDVVDGYNRKPTYNKSGALDAVGNLLEDCAVYWAYVNGNNDGQYLGDDRDVVAYLTRFPHCLVGNERGVEGCVNYALDVLDEEGAPAFRLLMMDSGAWDEGGEQYHGFLPTQTQWVMQQAQGVECAAFFHIPLARHAVAFAAGAPAADYPHRCPDADYSLSPTSAEMEAFLVGDPWVTLISVGHVHTDNFAAYLDGKYYHFGLNSGFNAGKGPGDDTGASLITVHQDGRGMARYSFAVVVF